MRSRAVGLFCHILESYLEGCNKAMVSEGNFRIRTSRSPSRTFCNGEEVHLFERSGCRMSGTSAP